MKAKRVLIVGGGSAGWTVAAYLNAALNTRDREDAKISLVESPDVPRISVGEATVPNIHRTLAVIGIDELEFMKAVDGTFKASIRFNNWLRNNNKFYHHPFSRFGSGPKDDAGKRWLMSDRSVPFMNTISAQPILCEMSLSAKPFEKVNLGIPVGYAFHMNALKYADYLRDFSTKRGVTHFLEHVTEVKVKESGDISAVETKSGKRLEADLFIDCTGFSAMLSEKALGVKWVDFSQWLLCDRALVMPVPYDIHYPGLVRPHTMSTAVSSGWIWDIPLQNRRGVGYVHSSAYISEDAAEQELRSYEGAHANALDTRLIHFKVGMREKAWSRNCISIGLSGGFLEPLESTGLYLNELAAELLAEHFPFGDDMEPFAFRFNRLMENSFCEILDFINMHYCLTRRTDTAFWREVARPERINDRLAAKLEFWRIKPPSISDFVDQVFPGQVDMSSSAGRPPIDTGRLWNHHSYEAILYGMDFLSDKCEQRYGVNRPRPAVHKMVLDAVNNARDKLPPHDVWLKRVLGMTDYPGP